MDSDDVDSIESVSFINDAYDWTPVRKDPTEVSRPPLKKQRMEQSEPELAPVKIYDEETNLLINQLLRTVKSAPGSFNAGLKSSSHGFLVPLPDKFFKKDLEENTQNQANLSITLDEVLSMPVLPGRSISLPEWGEPRERIRNTHLDVVSRPIDDVVISTLSPDCVSSQLLAKHIVSDLEKREPDERKIVTDKILAVLKKRRA